MYLYKCQKQGSDAKGLHPGHMCFKSSAFLEWQVMREKTAKHVCGLSSEFLQTM